jgi:Flp pilus assembly pilin Flp
MLGLLRDGRGATSIEYALIAVGIGVAILLAILALGVDITALLTGASAKLIASAPK